jgi:hypothetical protein
MKEDSAIDHLRVEKIFQNALFVSKLARSWLTHEFNSLCKNQRVKVYLEKKSKLKQNKGLLCDVIRGSESKFYLRYIVLKPSYPM